MGRYVGHITHSYSTDPTRPTFDETIQKAREQFLRNYLEGLTLEEREYALQNLLDEGYISI